MEAAVNRQGFIGGSDVAGIVGISPWTSPYRVWAETVGLYTPTDPDTELQDIFNFGNDAEAFLKVRFHRETGLHVYGEQTEVVHPDRPWARGHADGLVADHPVEPLEHLIIEPLGGWEAKTDRRSFGWTDVPPYYEAQVRWYMAVSGLPCWWVTVLTAGLRTRTFVIERDPDEEAFILDAVDRFWHDHVLTGNPPDIDGSDATAEVIDQLWPQHKPGSTVDLPEALVAEWRQVKADLKETGEHLAHVEAVLKAALGDAEAGLVDGRPAVTWQAQTSRRVAGLKEIQTVAPTLAAELEEAGLVRESSSRVLRTATTSSKKEPAA